MHVFALSTDPNEIFQGGLKSIDIQDSGTSADNLANSPQGQWFTAALSASPATWNIVETHQPIVSASTPQEGYYSSGVTPLGHMSTAYMQWFDNTKVDLVLSAHVHGFERLYNNGITYINNGTGGTYQSFHYFCEQPGATNSCENTYQVDPNFGGSSGTTWSNNKMIALTQMQVGNTYGFQLFQTSDTNNYLESQFWGSTDPANANGNGANWTLLDDFFILKNGRISASQAQSATGLELKALNGASNGFGIIDTSGATGPITLAALINGPGQLVVNGGGTLILTRPNVPTSAPSVYSGQNFSFMPASAKNTYSGGTYVTGGSTLQIANNSLLGASSGVLTLDAGMLKASQGFSSARAIVLGSGNGAINTNGNQVALSGQITGTGALTKIGGGMLTLSAASAYTGATAVNAGALLVNGSIASSSGLTVAPGALVGGNGFLPSTTINGILSPGNSIGTITVNGNLTFGPGGIYLVEVSPTAADRTNVTGTATLAGNVLAIFAPGSYITRQYTILHADQGVSGAFAGLSANAPTNFNASLSYDPDDVFLNLTAVLGSSVNGLSQNQVNVATAINGFFNNGGLLPPNFANLFGLNGINLANALSQLSGEAATAAQYGAFQLGNQFFALMLDPLVYGRGPGVGIAPGGGPMRLAAEETQAPKIALAYAKILKEPPARPRRFSGSGAGMCGPAVMAAPTAPRAIPWSSARMTSRRAPAAMEQGSIIASGRGRQWAWRWPAALPIGDLRAGSAAATATSSRPASTASRATAPPILPARRALPSTGCRPTALPSRAIISPRASTRKITADASRAAGALRPSSAGSRLMRRCRRKPSTRPLTTNWMVLLAASA